MVDRSIYWKGALLAILLFIASIAIGYYVEVVKYQEMLAHLNELNLEIDSSSTILLFTQSLPNTSSVEECKAIVSGLDPLGSQVELLRTSLEEGKGNVFLNYGNLRGMYFLTNLKLFLLTERYKKVCGFKDTILFFYNFYTDCPRCAVQGRILDEVKKKCGNDVYIFAFPLDVSKPSVLNVLKNYYGVTSAPTIVVNDKVLSGVHSADEIYKYLRTCKPQ